MADPTPTAPAASAVTVLKRTYSPSRPKQRTIVTPYGPAHVSFEGMSEVVRSMDPAVTRALVAMHGFTIDSAPPPPPPAPPEDPFAKPLRQGMAAATSAMSGASSGPAASGVPAAPTPAPAPPVAQGGAISIPPPIDISDGPDFEPDDDDAEPEDTDETAARAAEIDEYLRTDGGLEPADSGTHVRTLVEIPAVRELLTRGETEISRVLDEIEPLLADVRQEEHKTKVLDWLDEFDALERRGQRREMLLYRSENLRSHLVDADF